MERTYSIHSLGCKTNQSDALSYAGVLQRAGWREVPAEEASDLVLVQTCTVTMSADAQGRQMMRRIRRENPSAKILVSGCYAQRSEKEISTFPEVDYVIGNLNPRKWDLLSEIVGSPVSSQFPDFPLPAETARTRPYIKIQEGCDARCSYCIIPSVRGKSRSLPPDEVVRRVVLLRDQGYREMIFTGISMGAYGKDLAPKTSLQELIRRVDQIPGDFKIRLSSIEPEEIDGGFVDAFVSSGKFQPHLHLPLQSASDRVLKKMRRQYLFHHYDRVVSRLLKGCPDLNLGTDLLVGFPAEDREAFEETYRYVEQTTFGYCHVFPFSPRPETPAADYERCAADLEVSERALRLRELSKQKNYVYRKRFEGKRLAAIRLQGTEDALTSNYIRTRLECLPLPGKEFEYIRINKVDERGTTAWIA